MILRKIQVNDMDTKLDTLNAIDWEQRKWNAALVAMQGMLANPAFPKYSKEGYYKENIVENALAYADTLVAGYRIREDNKHEDSADINSIKCTQIGNQVWSDLLDIDVPGSVKINGIRYYTWEQAIQAAKKFVKLYGKEWRLPTKEDFIALAKEVNYNPDKLVELGFVKKGYYLDGSVHGAGSNAYYWSSTWYNDYYAYSLYFISGGVNPQNWNLKYLGFAVRCIKNT